MDDDMPWYMKNKYDQMDDQSSSMNKFRLMMMPWLLMTDSRRRFKLCLRSNSLRSETCQVPGSRIDMKRSLIPAMRWPPTFLLNLMSKKLSRENLDLSTWAGSRASWAAAKLPNKSCA